MLDLGFIRDIRRIVAALPTQRQSCLFSATMPQEVAQLAKACCVTRSACRDRPPGRDHAEDRAVRASRAAGRQAAAAAVDAGRLGAVSG